MGQKVRLGHLVLSVPLAAVALAVTLAWPVPICGQTGLFSSWSEAADKKIAAELLEGTDDFKDMPDVAPLDWWVTAPRSFWLWMDQPLPSFLPPPASIVVNKPRREPFHWKPALIQSFEFLVFEHGFRLADDSYARYLLFHRPFWHDYLASADHFYMNRWGDGDDFLVNYIGHPLEGAVAPASPAPPSFLARSSMYLITSPTV